MVSLRVFKFEIRNSQFEIPARVAQLEEAADLRPAF